MREQTLGEGERIIDLRDAGVGRGRAAWGKISPGMWLIWAFVEDRLRAEECICSTSVTYYGPLISIYLKQYLMESRKHNQQKPQGMAERSLKLTAKNKQARETSTEK